MTINLSRRLILQGAVGTSLAALAACGQDSQEQGAFPPDAEQFDPGLLGPKHGVSLLSRNENPYGPAPSALKMIDYAGRKGAYYTGDATNTLKNLIAERHGIDADQVAVTTGSGEALSAIALIYGPTGPIVAPRLFWDTTALYAARLGMAEIQRVPLTEDMRVDIPAIEAAVTEQTGLVQLCNPNNPTGLVSDPQTFKAAVKRMAAKTTVLVDEAYMELTDDPAANTCIDLVKQGHNVIIARTFSKIYGMAGIRVGYTISSPGVAEAIQKTAMSWIAGTGIAAAVGCYNDEKFLKYSKSKIIEAREMVLETTKALNLTALPSQTNFVYFKSGKQANDVQKAFAAKNIVIRGQYMDYNAWSRVSMGRLEDVALFCKTLPEVIAA